jgi:AbrB family looped-hinge helix DNA binding protein
VNLSVRSPILRGADRALPCFLPALAYLTSVLPQEMRAIMANPSSLKTRVSTKGQVVLPKAIRDRRGFGPGAELIVEERPEGVLLRPSPKAEATRVEDVFGRLGPVDRIVSIEEMNEGVLEEARRRWPRKTRDSD